MKFFHLTACDFMVYKCYKIGLNFVFPISRISSRIQGFTCSSIYHYVTIHHDIFLKQLPCEFPHRIIHKLLIMNFLIIDLLLPNFIQTRHTGGGILTKNNFLVPCDGVFDGFFKPFLCFNAFSTGYI